MHWNTDILIRKIMKNSKTKKMNMMTNKIICSLEKSDDLIITRSSVMFINFILTYSLTSFYNKLSYFVVDHGNIWFTAGYHDFKLYLVLHFVYQYFRQLERYGVRSVEIELGSTFEESKIVEEQKYKILKKGLKTA